MTEPTSDELLSAYIDELADPDEVQLIEADPELMARADTLRGAARLVGTPVTQPDAAAVDAAVAAALEQSRTAANVTALAGRPRRQSRIMKIAAAAAVVAVLFLAGAVLLAIEDGDSGGDDVAATFDGDGDGAAASTAPATEEELLEESDSGRDPALADESTEEALSSNEESADFSGAESPAAPSERGEASTADDDAADSATESAAPQAEAADVEPAAFADLDALMAALRDGDPELSEADPPLPCALVKPTPRAGAVAVAVLAALPDGTVVVTGWRTSGVFEVAAALQVDTCTNLELPTP